MAKSKATSTTSTKAIATPNAQVITAEVIATLKALGLDVSTLTVAKATKADEIDSKTKFWESTELIASLSKAEIIAVITRLTTPKPQADATITLAWNNGVVSVTTEKRFGTTWIDFKTIFTSHGMTHEGNTNKGTFKWVMSKANFDTAIKDWNAYLATGTVTITRKK